MIADIGDLQPVRISFGPAPAFGACVGCRCGEAGAKLVMFIALRLAGSRPPGVAAGGLQCFVFETHLQSQEKKKP